MVYWVFGADGDPEGDAGAGTQLIEHGGATHGVGQLAATVGVQPTEHASPTQGTVQLGVAGVTAFASGTVKIRGLPFSSVTSNGMYTAEAPVPLSRRRGTTA